MLAEFTFVLTMTTPFAQQGVTPNGTPTLCNYAKVLPHPNGAKLKVYAKATRQSKRIDSLAASEVVYTCDETRAWTQIFYGNADKSCKAGTPNGLPETQRADCASGWVQTKWIDIISG